MTVWFNDLNKIYYISYCIQISVGSLSCVCGIITLLLIYYMKVWNRFLLVIVTLSICQFFYDTSIYFCNQASYPTCYSDMFVFMTFYMGLSSTLWTNAMIIVLYLTIQYFNFYILTNYFYVFFFAINCFSLSYAIVGIILLNVVTKNIFNDVWFVYNLLRLLSIIFNFIVIGLIYYRVKSYDRNNPIFELISRIIYYPIVQIVARSFPAWYELQYIINSDDDNVNTTKTVSLIFYSIFLFSAGIGFFIVFLIVQPNAFEFLKKNIKLFFGLAINNNILVSRELKNNNNNLGMVDLSNNTTSSVNLKLLSDTELTQLIIDCNQNESSNVSITTESGFHKSESDISKSPDVHYLF